MVGPAAKRAAVAHLQDTMGLSERRACSIASADRTMVRYRSCRPPDTEVRARLRELANERRRFGYRRLFVLLRREGEPSGINRIHRLYAGIESPLALEKQPQPHQHLLLRQAEISVVHDLLCTGKEALVDDRLKNWIEPLLDCRRLFGLSYAAMAGCSSMA